MRIGTGDEFLRTSGGTLTGALTISADTQPLLILNRTTAAAAAVVRLATGGVPRTDLVGVNAQPFYRISEPGIADRLTLRTDTGLLGTALIPLSLLRVQESFASNAGAVAVLAANTTVVSAAVITVAVGDRILIGYEVAHLKGAVAGDSRFFIQQTAGTGTVLFLNNAGALAGVGAIANLPNQVNATTWPASGYVEARATVAGTVTLSLVGASQGSNGNVAIGDGQIHVEHLRG